MSGHTTDETFRVGGYAYRAIHMVVIGEWTTRKALEEIEAYMNGAEYDDSAYTS